jgi:hypothetical protein
MDRLTTLQQYLLGLCATLLGAAGSELTGSMLPLALGAAWTVMVTLNVLRRIRTRSKRD